MEQRLFRCRYCKERVPLEELRVRIPQVCKQKSCVSDYFEEYKDRVIQSGKKALKRKQRAEKEAAKSKRDLEKELEKVFNYFIRLRDSKDSCICCGHFAKYWDAGHYFGVGSHPELRFDEENVHKCCTRCNQFLDGNLAEYAIGLEAKIGTERFEALRQRRGKEQHYTKSDLREKIKEYKQKVKELKKEI